MVLVLMANFAKAQVAPKNDFSPYWNASLSWLQKEAKQAGIEMRGVILPTDLEVVKDLLHMNKGEMLAATFYKDFKINDSQYPTCAMGRYSEADWGDWLSVMGEGREDWVRFWFVAHEWGHCLDMMEGGLTATSTDSEKLRGERRADAFAVLIMMFSTKSSDFVKRLAEQRERNMPGSSHDTGKVIRYFTTHKNVEIGGTMDKWWSLAKQITDEVYR